MTAFVDDPLTSWELSNPDRRGNGQGSPGEMPLALRQLDDAPERDLPDYRYDPVRQVAVDTAGRPLAPSMKKDWTSIKETHTDGDGGDNEQWTWEEK